MARSRARRNALQRACRTPNGIVFPPPTAPPNCSQSDVQYMHDFVQGQNGQILMTVVQATPQLLSIVPAAPQPVIGAASSSLAGAASSSVSAATSTVPQSVPASSTTQHGLQQLQATPASRDASQQYLMTPAESSAAAGAPYEPGPQQTEDSAAPAPTAPLEQLSLLQTQYQPPSGDNTIDPQSPTVQRLLQAMPSSLPGTPHDTAESNVVAKDQDAAMAGSSPTAPYMPTDDFAMPDADAPGQDAALPASPAGAPPLEDNDASATEIGVPAWFQRVFEALRSMGPGGHFYDLAIRGCIDEITETETAVQEADLADAFDQLQSHGMLNSKTVAGVRVISLIEYRGLGLDAYSQKVLESLQTFGSDLIRYEDACRTFAQTGEVLYLEYRRALARWQREGVLTVTRDGSIQLILARNMPDDRTGLMTASPAVFSMGSVNRSKEGQGQNGSSGGSKDMVESNNAARSQAAAVDEQAMIRAIKRCIVEAGRSTITNSQLHARIVNALPANTSNAMVQMVIDGYVASGQITLLQEDSSVQQQQTGNDPLGRENIPGPMVDVQGTTKSASKSSVSAAAATGSGKQPPTARQLQVQATYAAQQAAGLAGAQAQVLRDNQTMQKIYWFDSHDRGAMYRDFQIRGRDIPFTEAAFHDLLSYLNGSATIETDRHQWSYGDESFFLNRRAILSLWGKDWLEDGMVGGIMKVLFPSKIRGNVTIAQFMPLQVLLMYLEARLDDLDEAVAFIKTMVDNNVTHESGIGALPWSFEADIDVAVGMVNEGNMHWFAFRADKATRKVGMVDSWSKDDPLEQAARQQANENRLHVIFNAICNTPYVDPSWNGVWTVATTTDTVYQQRNSYDCGLHALRNLEDLVRNGSPLPYHDAKELRVRYALTLAAAAKGQYFDENSAWAWGDPIPYEDDLVTRWQAIAAERVIRKPKAAARTGTLSNSSSDSDSDPEAPDGDSTQYDQTQEARRAVAAIVADQNASLSKRNNFVLWLASITPGTVLQSPNPLAKHITASYRSVAIALLQSAAPHALDVKQMAWLYQLTLWQMGSEELRTSMDRIMAGMTKFLSRPLATVRRATPTAGGAVSRATKFVFNGDPTGQVRGIDQDAVTFFGGPATGPAATHRQALVGVNDDIDRDAALVVAVQRFSVIQEEGTEKRQYDPKGTAEETCRKNLAYWDLVFNRERDSPRRIMADRDVILGDQMAFYYQITRDSSCPVFTGKRGQVTDMDTALIEILTRLNDLARQAGTQPRVIFLVVGGDGWTTDAGSWLTLVRQFPELDMRITMVMPNDRVLAIPYMFRPRDVTNGGEGFSVAHFDLRDVVRLQEELTADPETDLRFHRRDVSGFLHFMTEVAEFKDMIRFTRDAIRGEDDLEDEEEAQLNQKLSKIGHKLIAGLQRNTFRLPECDKTCIMCDQITEGLWHRAGLPGDSTGDVICDRDECQPMRASGEQDMVDAQLAVSRLRYRKAKAIKLRKSRVELNADYDEFDEVE
ncbi:hypothetical protein LTR95_009824 [Oleoguttula sp. CCFEE 5521]